MRRLLLALLLPACADPTPVEDCAVPDLDQVLELGTSDARQVSIDTDARGTTWIATSDDTYVDVVQLRCDGTEGERRRFRPDPDSWASGLQLAANDHGAFLVVHTGDISRFASLDREVRKRDNTVGHWRPLGFTSLGLGVRSLEAIVWNFEDDTLRSVTPEGYQAIVETLPVDNNSARDSFAVDDQDQVHEIRVRWVDNGGGFGSYDLERSWVHGDTTQQLSVPTTVGLVDLFPHDDGLWVTGSGGWLSTATGPSLLEPCDDCSLGRVLTGPTSNLHVDRLGDQIRATRFDGSGAESPEVWLDAPHTDWDVAAVGDDLGVLVWVTPEGAIRARFFER